METGFLTEQDVFYSGTLQNYQIKNINVFTSTSKIFTWKSIGYAEKKIENITTSNSNFAPALINYYQLPDIKFDENCLINNNIIDFGMINIYISNTRDWWSKDLDTDFTFGNCLFGSVKLTKNADQCKYK